MFEIPEILTLARQFTQTLIGKTIESGSLGNSPHKFVWYNRQPDEFTGLTSGKTIGKADGKGRWLFVSLHPGYVLVLGECGGKILYHPVGTPLPEKYHLKILFTDGSSLTVMTQMWGAMELYEAGREKERQYIKNFRFTPIEPGFTFDYFSSLIDQLVQEGKRSVKSLLTQDQLVPGLGNAIAQDIMFLSRLHPRHALGDLTSGQKCDLYSAILDTVHAVTEKGGRNDEFDLFGKPGGYVRIMDKSAAGKPCPDCGHIVEKIQYLGGACYLCARCQV
jgi:formamidopyrimidine-DNA glycosylase